MATHKHPRSHCKSDTAGTGPCGQLERAYDILTSTEVDSEADQNPTDSPFSAWGTIPEVTMAGIQIEADTAKSWLHSWPSGYGVLPILS